MLISFWQTEWDWCSCYHLQCAHIHDICSLCSNLMAEHLSRRVTQWVSTLPDSVLILDGYSIVFKRNFKCPNGLRLMTDGRQVPGQCPPDFRPEILRFTQISDDTWEMAGRCLAGRLLNYHPMVHSIFFPVYTIVGRWHFLQLVRQPNVDF